MIQNESRFDQTQFSLEEPMYEGLASLPPEENLEEPKEKIPLLKQKKFVMGLIGGSILLVILLLFVINAIIANNRRPFAPIITPLSSNSGTFSHPIEAKIDILENELKTYDEDQSTLVMPAVDYEIKLDEDRN